MTERRTTAAQEVWLRPAPRPDCGREDVGWWWKLDTGVRMPTPYETPHKCSTKNCPNEAWLVREQTVGGWCKIRHTRRRWCCETHVYGETMVEDGKVYCAYPRFPDDFDTGRELAAKYGAES